MIPLKQQRLLLLFLLSIRSTKSFSSTSSRVAAIGKISNRLRQQQRGQCHPVPPYSSYSTTTNFQMIPPSVSENDDIKDDTDVQLLIGKNGNNEGDINHMIQDLLNNKDDDGANDRRLRKTVEYLQQILTKETVPIATSPGRAVPSISMSRTTWDMIFDSIEERIANADENASKQQQQIQQQQQRQNTLQGTDRAMQLAPVFSIQNEARQEMTDMYRTLKDINQLRLYGAASTSIHSRSLPAMGSYTVPPDVLRTILDIPMTALTPKPTNTLLYAGIAFALLEVFLSTMTGIPFNIYALATLVFVLIDRIFINGAIIETCLKLLSPGMAQKVTRHEAGHFLVAYLLGCPLEGIVLSAWGALNDKRFKDRAVSAGTSFYDPELSEQMNKNGRGVTRSSIDRYSIIVMAGIAAEADLYGQADGGAGDEMALVAFLAQLSNNNSSNDKNRWNSETIRNQARWGAVQAMLLLRQYKPAYDALVDTLERGNSTLKDCIYAIEKAGRDSNLDPVCTPYGSIVEDPVTKSVVWDTSIVPIKHLPNTNNEHKHHQPQLVDSPSAATTLHHINTNSVVVPSSSTTTAAAPREANKKTEFDIQEAQKSLAQYRAEMQRKLEHVENRLKEIEQQQK